MPDDPNATDYSVTDPTDPVAVIRDRLPGPKPDVLDATGVLVDADELADEYDRMKRHGELYEVPGDPPEVKRP